MNDNLVIFIAGILLLSFYYTTARGYKKKINNLYNLCQNLLVLLEAQILIQKGIKCHLQFDGLVDTKTSDTIFIKLPIEYWEKFKKKHIEENLTWCEKTYSKFAELIKKLKPENSLWEKVDQFFYGVVFIIGGLLLFGLGWFSIIKFIKFWKGF